MSKKLQDHLFEKILDAYPKRSAAVEALGKLLDLGKDAVYRRLSGQTLLGADELVNLARHFNISIDDFLFDRRDTVICSYNSFSNKIGSYKDYLQEVSQNIQQVYLTQGARFYYATSEIPLFHYCHFPELIGFKLYVWARTTWSFPEMLDQGFHFDLIPEEDLRMCSELLNMYNAIPSTELWHLNIVDNTLNQIEYHVNSGGFHRPEDALILCDKVLALTEHIRKMAELGHKFNIGTSPEPDAAKTFDLFHNEVIFTSNTFLAVMPVGKVIYTTFCNPNFLKIADQQMCDYTENWFRGIIGKSISISNHAEKSRAWYFNALKRKVMQVQNRIKNQLEEGF